jgi:uncharacterized membrane protein
LAGALRVHLRHHLRFYAAGLFGVAVYAVAHVVASPSLPLILAGDAFFAAYLSSSAFFVFRATPRDLRQHASYADEGVIVILILTLCAVSLCLIALFALLGAGGGRPVCRRMPWRACCSAGSPCTRSRPSAPSHTTPG